MSFLTVQKNLPRSLDVQISLSRPQAETRTNLTILCVACENLGFLHNIERIRFYSSIEAVETDFAVGSEAHFAASAFFSQSPRATTMALGEVFMTDQKAVLASAIVSASELAAIELITDGSMDIDYNLDGGSADSTESLTGLDFTGVADLDDVATVIGAALSADLSCVVKTLPGGTEVLTIVTSTSGDGVTISYPVAGATGTFVGALLNLTSAEGGRAINGYSATNIGDELTNLVAAADAAGENIYGWCLGASLRVDAIQVAAAAWVLPRVGVMSLVTNDANAKVSSYTSDIGSTILATDNKRVELRYHDNAQQYPDVSMMAYMLHVNYALEDSTVTSKFKQLPGISTVALSESEWLILQNKGFNTYTGIGNSANTNRDGNMASSGWWYDSVVNFDNFGEDLSVNVFNIFLRRKKVPYTTKGQNMLATPLAETGDQYVFNGTLADREITDTTKKGGKTISPAFDIIRTPISSMSVAQRAQRIGPPMEMIVNEAGAMHSVAINVEIVS